MNNHETNEKERSNRKGRKIYTFLSYTRIHVDELTQKYKRKFLFLEFIFTFTQEGLFIIK